MNRVIETPSAEVHAAERNPIAFVNAVRIHTALTADLEKRLLMRMARRMPAAVHSDHLTALALAAQICAGIAYALSAHDVRALWLVNCSPRRQLVRRRALDGTVARIRNQQRPRYGFYVDHIVDAFWRAGANGGARMFRLFALADRAGMLVFFMRF